MDNSLLSFTKAIDMGADVIELDAQLTKDLIVVVYHDVYFHPNSTKDKTHEASGDHLGHDLDGILIRDIIIVN